MGERRSDPGKPSNCEDGAIAGVQTAAAEESKTLIINSLTTNRRNQGFKRNISLRLNESCRPGTNIHPRRSSLTGGGIWRERRREEEAGEWRIWGAKMNVPGIRLRNLNVKIYNMEIIDPFIAYLPKKEKFNRSETLDEQATCQTLTSDSSKKEASNTDHSEDCASHWEGNTRKAERS